MNRAEDQAAPGGNALLLAIGCYGIWGILPFYFHLLQDVGPVEVVAQRIIWSLLLLLVLIAMRSGLRAFRDVLRSPALMLPLTASALLICANWLIYVWAIHHGHVVAASLGYFLNPLINILLGVVFLKERLRRWQLAAVALAAAGVAALASAAIDTVWVSLGLAFSFAFYSLLRKVTPVQPMRGLGAETVVLTPFAIAYLLWLNTRGQMIFGTDLRLSLLLVLAGAVTAFPLLLFAMAAQKLSMATMGLLQYIAPTLVFLTGIFFLGETLNLVQLSGFVLIWVGLILFTVDSLRAVRGAKRITA